MSDHETESDRRGHDADEARAKGARRLAALMLVPTIIMTVMSIMLAAGAGLALAGHDVVSSVFCLVMAAVTAMLATSFLLARRAWLAYAKSLEAEARRDEGEQDHT